MLIVIMIIYFFPIDYGTRGRVEVTMEEFDESFTGICLLFCMISQHNVKLPPIWMKNVRRLTVSSRRRRR